MPRAGSSLGPRPTRSFASCRANPRARGSPAQGVSAEVEAAAPGHRREKTATNRGGRAFRASDLVKVFLTPTSWPHAVERHSSKSSCLTGSTGPTGWSDRLICLSLFARPPNCSFVGKATLRLGAAISNKDAIWGPAVMCGRWSGAGRRPLARLLLADLPQATRRLHVLRGRARSHPSSVDEVAALLVRDIPGIDEPHVRLCALFRAPGKGVDHGHGEAHQRSVVAIEAGRHEPWVEAVRRYFGALEASGQLGS